MSIPLIQDNNKDSINTSIIAIKRNIDRINTLLGVSDSGSSDPDLSGLATKQELQDAVNSLQPVDEVTLNNMHSVTSNAVALALQGGGWQTLVDKQYRGTFTIPDSASEVLLMLVNSSLNVWIGSFYIMMSMFDSNTTRVIIPCDNSSRSIWDVSNNGKTFTHYSSSGDYRISVFYK